MHNVNNDKYEVWLKMDMPGFVHWRPSTHLHRGLQRPTKLNVRAKFSSDFPSIGQLDQRQSQSLVEQY